MALVLLLLLLCDPLRGERSTLLQAQGQEITNIDRYFPDTVGSKWTYRGRVTQSDSQPVTEVVEYTNTVTISGTHTLSGVEVTVIRESNPANRGLRESYFRKDPNGVTYYGSKPTTRFEEQLVPYTVIPFPAALGLSFFQIEKKGILFGRDVDGDGQEEHADVVATGTLLSRETVSVPAGTFPNCLRIEGVMTVAIMLSESGKSLTVRDTLTQWYGEDIGLIKSVEAADFPSLPDQQANLTVITEELERHSVKF